MEDNFDRESRRKLNGDSDIEWQRRVNEVRGPRYQLDVSDQDQRGDANWALAWPGTAPEVLPVSQEIEHGPDLSRGQQFAIGSQDAIDVTGHEFEPWVFNDRRDEGRRFRPGYADDDAVYEPYERPEIDPDRFSSH